MCTRSYVHEPGYLSHFVSEVSVSKDFTSHDPESTTNISCAHSVEIIGYIGVRTVLTVQVMRH
jgi:hypothetical protein